LVIPCLCALEVARLGIGWTMDSHTGHTQNRDGREVSDQ